MSLPCPIKEQNYLIGWENLYYPIGIALLVFLFGNSLTLGFRRIKLIFEFFQKKHIDKYDIMSEEESEEAKNELREYENRINLQGADLNRKNEGLTSELQKVNLEFATYKKENDGNVKYVEDINKQIVKVEEERDNLKGGVEQYKASHELNKKAIKKLEEEIKILKNKGSESRRRIYKAILNKEIKFAAPSNLFVGSWANTYIDDKGDSGTEVFIIKNENEYWMGNNHEFDIIEFKVEGRKISFVKRKKSTGGRLINNLFFMSNNFIEGIEDGRPIKYTKAEDPKNKLVLKKID